MEKLGIPHVDNLNFIDEFPCIRLNLSANDGFKARSCWEIKNILEKKFESLKT